MAKCDVCDGPATVIQQNAAERVSTFRCDDHLLRDTGRYVPTDLVQAPRLRLAETQRRLHAPGRMFA